MKKTAVVIPILNEQDVLNKQLSVLKRILDKVIGNNCWKIIFVNNGSTDQSGEIIDLFCLKNGGSEHLFLPHPNYGQALKVGLANADSDYVFIKDIDQLDKQFIQFAWQHRYDFDIITGSKRLDPSICSEPKFRTFLSWGLNALLNLMFRYSGTDTHGPKLMNLKKLRPTVKLCKSSRGQFDTEIVLRSFFYGARILEVPIRYQNLRNPRNLMIWKVVRNFYGLALLFYQLKNISVKNKTRVSAVSADEMDTGSRSFR